MNISWQLVSADWLSLRWLWEGSGGIGFGVRLKLLIYTYKYNIMSGEVVTQDLGDGYQLNTYNVETYYKT